MAGVPIKFRCYRCNQLLGVARSKAGAVVDCPKCSAELIVPEPPPAEPETGVPSGQNLPEPSTSTLDSGLALDFLDIRPEDIRVEPGAHDYRPAATAEVAPEPVYEAPLAPAPPPVEEALPPAPEPVVPPIRLDAPKTVRAAEAARLLPARPRDLILPRSVVTAWSLFVLLALALAFIAGLLAGHYVWRVH